VEAPLLGQARLGQAEEAGVVEEDPLGQALLVVAEAVVEVVRALLGVEEQPSPQPSRQEEGMAVARWAREQDRVRDQARDRVQGQVSHPSFSARRRME